MKLRRGVASLLGAAVLIPIAALAQGSPSASSTAASPPQAQASPAYGSSVQTITGAVVSVDAKSRKLTVKTWDNRETEFSVSSYTALTLGRTDAKLSDLKAGQQVIITAEKNKAVSIALSTSDLNSRRVKSGSQASGQPSSPAATESMKNSGATP